MSRKPKKLCPKSVMEKYRCATKFWLLVHLMTLLFLVQNTEELQIDLNSSSVSCKPHNYKRVFNVGSRALSNQCFTVTCIYCLFTITCDSWLMCLLLQAGDVHPNPGPSSTTSESSMSSISAGSTSRISRENSCTSNTSF